MPDIRAPKTRPLGSTHSGSRQARPPNARRTAAASSASVGCVCGASDSCACAASLDSGSTACWFCCPRGNLEMCAATRRSRRAPAVAVICSLAGSRGRAWALSGRSAVLRGHPSLHASCCTPMRRSSSPSPGIHLIAPRIRHDAIRSASQLCWNFSAWVRGPADKIAARRCMR